MIKMKLLLRTKIRENSQIKWAMKEGTSLQFTEIKGIWEGASAIVEIYNVFQKPVS